jgi:ATPase family associated with various cellular activities (AAA)
MGAQLWQQARIKSLDEFVGHTEAVRELRQVRSGFILIEGGIGCGKTSLALAYVHERSGRRIEEHQLDACLGSFYVQHLHANDFEIADAEKAKFFFTRSTPTWLVIDEAQELTAKRQQSRLKTIPLRPDLTLILVTQEPEALEASVRDRCVKIHLGGVAARELPALVKRGCEIVGIPFDAEIVRACNRAEIFRPRAVLNIIEAVARGKTPAHAIAGQA